MKYQSRIKHKQFILKTTRKAKWVIYNGKHYTSPLELVYQDYHKESAENKTYGIIYKAENKINRKVYIGQTTRSLNERKYSHIYTAERGDGYVFQRAIRKYGAENFIWEIIDCAYNKAELYEKEKYWIKFYKSFIREDGSWGYNMTIGGEGASGVDHSGEKNSMFGKKQTELSKNRNRINQESRIEVVAFDFDGNFVKEFPSINNASIEIKGDVSVISKACKGKYHHAYGYKWFYKDEFSINLLDKKLNKLKSRIPKKIIQCDLDGNYIKIHNNAEDCANDVDGCPSTIHKCCKGKNKSHKGYTYYYEEDYKGVVV